MTADQKLIESLYDGFNTRDIDAVLAMLTEDVAWANGMEGTHVHGHEAVREYWTYQWSVIDPSVTPLGMSQADDGATVVDVQLVVRDLQGEVQLDEVIQHVFHVKDGKVMRFDIVGPSQLKNVSHQA